MMMASAERRQRNDVGLASSALKGAGLMDRDSRMRDAPAAGPSSAAGSHGPRKGHAKSGAHTNKKSTHGHRQRAIDPFKTAGVADLNSRLLATRIKGLVSNPLAIRGAAARPPGTVRSRTGEAAARPLDVWREFVQKRYNAEAQFLNLERMSDDEVLKKHNMPPPGRPGGSGKEMAVVFKLASQLKPPVQTISLANNKLSSGMPLATLAHYLPKLSNLSLQNNELKTWRDIDLLSGRREKLAQIREIVLLGNPVRDFELNNGRAENYRSQMIRRFPSLEVLDQEAIAKISFDVAAPATKTSTSRASSRGPAVAAKEFPLPMAPSFITGVDGTVISNFLSRFFPLFDTSRAALASVYAPNATFSYSVNTDIPARARVRGYHYSKEMPNQRKLEWPPWLFPRGKDGGGSRNLTRLGGGQALERVVRSLHIGPEEIVKAMLDLPVTSHRIAGGEAERFVVDAWPVGQGEEMLLFVSIHGEFAEEPSQGIRSFDRSLVLAPAPASSKARLDGWDVMILSDQLIVRAYSSHEAWAPGPMKVQDERASAPPPVSTPMQSVAPLSSPARGLAPLPLSGLPSQPAGSQIPTLTPEAQAQLNAALSTIPEPQRSLVFTIMQRTGLNVAFAVQCLEGNGWDVEKAVANFEQVKGTLTREAFL